MHSRIFTLLLVFALLTVSAAAADAPAMSDAVEPGSVVFLLYHDLVQGELTDKNDPEYTITAENFRADLAALLESGRVSISCAEYLAGNYDKSRDYFCVTFDDGYLSNYTVAYPILAELGVTGDIFMCTEMTSLANHFNWRQAELMEESGVIKIYSHTAKHIRLSDTSLPSFKYSVERSYAYFRAKLSGERDMLFSYPNSDYSAESVKALYNIGVKLQFVQVMPIEGEFDDCAEFGLLRRYNVANDSDILELIKR